MKANIADVYNLQLMINRRTNSLGLAASFSDEVVTAHTTEKSIVFPRPKLPTTTEELDLLYGYMIHECGHHTRSRAFDILRNAGLNNDHPLYCLYNIVEDNAMEKEVSYDYKGDRKALGRGMLFHVKRQCENLAKMPDEYFNQDDTTKMMAVYKAAIESRKGWDDWAEHSSHEMDHWVTDSARELYVALESEGWVKRLASDMNPDEAWTTACDLMARLFPDKEKETEEQKEKGQSSVGDKDEGKDKEKASGTEDVGKGDGDKVEAEAPAITYSWKDWVNSDHDEDKGPPAVCDWEGHKDEDYKLLDLSHVRVTDCLSARSGKYSATHSNAASLANAIRIYIQATSRKKFTPEQYKGKIDRRSVVRLAFPPVDRGEWNKKIFYKLDQKKYKNTCIGILTDWSGSMNGQKKEIAVQATAKLAEVFDTQLKVPTFITAFSGGWCSCDIGIIKPFNKFVSTNDICSKFQYFDSYTSGNADGDALLWMYNQMAQRKEDRKILLVLSDGSPTDGAEGSNPDSLLKAVTSAIQKDPTFSLIGIGIASNAVKRYYKNNRVINAVLNLDKVLLEVLKEVYTHE